MNAPLLLELADVLDNLGPDEVYEQQTLTLKIEPGGTYACALGWGIQKMGHKLGIRYLRGAEDDAPEFEFEGRVLGTPWDVTEAGRRAFELTDDEAVALFEHPDHDYTRAFYGTDEPTAAVAAARIRAFAS